MQKVRELIGTYSPWITESDDSPALKAWRESIPEFHRPVYQPLISDLMSLQQIISVTGPRRVGKSTLLRQIIRRLLHEEKVPAKRVLYYAFDDPALFRKDISGGEFVELIMQESLKYSSQEPLYLLLDEIQKLDRWEQYLKKYYDLNYPVKIVISGSASSPIFKKSRESLLGRVKDYHILPFSFREYLLFRLSGSGSDEPLFKDHEQSTLLAEMSELHAAGEQLKGMFVDDPRQVDISSVTIPQMSDRWWSEAEGALSHYLLDGGFPEVWRMKTEEQKLEYLFDNQVKKVITEDLVLAVEFRKPELLKRFYISLLESPGREVNLSSLSQEIGINVQQIDKYLPLLEMTDLIRHASKFRASSLRPRRGNTKYYPVDIALRNAVLRIGNQELLDDETLGLYAETLVFNSLVKWQGVLAVDYYRERVHEVDFIVHTRPASFLPIEVKYRNNFSSRDLSGTIRFLEAGYKCHMPALVTKGREAHGLLTIDKHVFFQFPLLQFLVLFD